MKRDRPSRPWHLYLLALAAVAVVVLAIVEIGPPSSSARSAREVVTAANGVVQSTVTGSGNLQAGTNVDVNFKTSGTLQDVYVSVGQHVTQGQLLATLDPTSAQLTLDQAETNLTAAQDQLTEVEDGTASGSSAASTGGGGGASSTSLTTDSSPNVEFVSDVHSTRVPTGSSNPAQSTTSPKKTSPSGSRTTSSTPSSSSSSSSRGSSSSSSRPSSSGSGSSSGSSTTKTTTTPSPSSIASAQASIYSAEASVHTAQQAVDNTKLYAPSSGTIVSLASLSPGDSVSGGSNGTAGSSSSSSTGSSGTSGGGAGLAGGSSTAGGLGSSGSSSSGSSSTGSSSTGSSSGSSAGSSSLPFAQIVDTGTMTMTVPLSESDISKVQVGQAATITPDALSGVELAAHVSQIATVGTTSSGVVSYNTTLTLDQSDSQLKAGMSASASIIVNQAQGVTLPNQAVTGTGSLGTVNVLRNGKSVAQRVIIGLRGDSRTQIVSGLSSGQQVAVTISLPSISESTSTTGSSGTLGSSRFGGGGAGGGAGGFFGGAGGGGGIARAFRGGGG